MIDELKAYAAALDDWPNDWGKQHHFSVILPNLLEKLKAVITDELTYNEMWVLMEVLDSLMYGSAKKDVS